MRRSCVSSSASKSAKGTAMFRAFLVTAVLGAMVLTVSGCKRPAPAPVIVVMNNQPDPKPDAVAPPVDPAGKPPAPPAGVVDAGDTVLPADKAPADAPLRPIKGIPIYKLSNLRVGNPGPGPGPK